MSWATVISTAVQAGVGVYQTTKGKQLADEAGPRPEYEVPQAMQEALGSAQLRSMQGIPAATKSQMLQEMDRARLSSLRQIGERRGGLGVVSQLEQKQQDAIREMGVMDIEQREKNIQNLQDTQLKMAGYQEKGWEHELAGWEQKSQAAAAMKGAGMQNIGGAAISLGTAAAGGAFKKKETTDTDDILLQQQQQQTTTETPLTQQPQLRTTETGAGAGTSGALDAQNYEFNPLTKKIEFNPGKTAFATGGGLSLEGQQGSLYNKIDASGLNKGMGFGGGPGFNEGITSNLGLSSALNRFDTNNPPSLQRQSFGAGVLTGGGSSGDPFGVSSGGTFKQKLLGAESSYQKSIGGTGGTGGTGGLKLGGGGPGDEWKKNFPSLYPEYA